MKDPWSLNIMKPISKFNWEVSRLSGNHSAPSGLFLTVSHARRTLESSIGFRDFFVEN